MELRNRRVKTPTKPTEAQKPARAKTSAKTPAKTPRTSKRKATEDVSPAATKKQKAVKATPAKGAEEAVAAEVESSPAVKEAKPTPKKASKKTPKKIESEEAVTEPKEERSEKTPKKATEKPEPDETVVEPVSEKKREKTPKKGTKKAEPEETVVEPVSEKSRKTPKKAAPKKIEPEQPVVQEEKEAELAKEAEVVEEAEEEQPASDGEVDEQTHALAQAVDSGDEDEHAPEQAKAFRKGQAVGAIPKISKKDQKALKAPRSSGNEDTGVIYIGRLPHGFYEHELKGYFSQFGPILNLRLSRNRKDGRSKHYAFIEFEEASTAEIVAKTMDNYLLFGHILKCSVIPKAQVHDELFKGANRRFKAVPWNKMAGKVLERPHTESTWERKIVREEKKRVARAKKLKALGYEFSGPELMSPAGAKAITQKGEAESEAPKAIEEASAAPAVEEQAEPAIEEKSEPVVEEEAAPAEIDEVAEAEKEESAEEAVEKEVAHKAPKTRKTTTKKTSKTAAKETKEPAQKRGRKARKTKS